MGLDQVVLDDNYGGISLWHWPLAFQQLCGFAMAFATLLQVPETIGVGKGGEWVDHSSVASSCLSSLQAMVGRQGCGCHWLPSAHLKKGEGGF